MATHKPDIRVKLTLPDDQPHYNCHKTGFVYMLKWDVADKLIAEGWATVTNEPLSADDLPKWNDANVVPQYEPTQSAEVDELKAIVAGLAAQVAALTAGNAPVLTEVVKRGPGRPPKYRDPDADNAALPTEAVPVDEAA